MNIAKSQVNQMILNTLLGAYSTRAKIALFPLSLRERAGVRVFKKKQIVTVHSIVVLAVKMTDSICATRSDRKPANAGHGHRVELHASA